MIGHYENMNNPNHESSGLIGRFIEESLEYYSTGLIETIKEKILDENSTPLVFDHRELFSKVQTKFSFLFDYLGNEIEEVPFLVRQSAEWLQDSYIVQLSDAKRSFEMSLAKEVVNLDSLGETFRALLKDTADHLEEFGALAIIGSTIGGAVFIVGTIFQIVYDIFNAFITIIKYAYYGAKYAISATADLLKKGEQPAVDSNVLASLISAFDLQSFLTNDLPEIFWGTLEFAKSIADDFITNAHQYGKTTGEYINLMFQNSVSGVTSMLFDAYDHSASVAQKIWWSIKQWFNLGTMFGPIIVDIALLFCSGGVSGVVSAAAKLGKVDKIADVMRFTKVAGSTIEGLAAYRQIVSRIPTRLSEIIYKLFQQLWDAAGGALDKIKDAMRKAYEMVSDKSELPEFEEIAESVQSLYDKAEGVNFFIAIILMVFGGSINEKGEFALS